MNEKFYAVYKLYLKLTNSKKVSRSELDEIKKAVGKDILNTKLKDVEDEEDIDLSIYFKTKK